MASETTCRCGGESCTGPADNEHHQCGGPAEACAVPGCGECGTPSETEARTEPPFDGKPCPACHSAIRNLAAVAHNVVARRNGARWSKFWEGIDELERAVKAAEPLFDAHFADAKHSHPAEPSNGR